MPSIRKSLLQFVFSGAFMKRWNDKLRPMELLELDKQAHKMMAAFVLYELNSAGLDPTERLLMGRRIVEGGLFDYFYRLIITDIKPPIFYQIKANPEHYRRLTAWVMARLEPVLHPLGPELWARLQDHLEADMNPALQPDPAQRILKASHLYASRWEFQLTRTINRVDEEFDEIEHSFDEQLRSYSDLTGLDDIWAGRSSPLGRFLHLCGQLRFQKRWSQTPRVPETSVIGHMFLVAAYAYFFSLAVEACPARAQNNFFAGLFHDLPELLTRDIISPVKNSVEGIGDIIKEYEDTEMRRRVFAPLAADNRHVLVERIRYFLGMDLGSEFTDAIRLDGQAMATSFHELQARYNENRFDPKDGEMLRVCDRLAAFVEAYTALRNGVSSEQLQQATFRVRQDYHNFSLGPLHIGTLFADFD